MRAVAAALERGRRAAARRRPLRARDDRRHERAARGARCARTALLATEGFTDLEELGRQARARALPAVRGAPARRSCRPSCASPLPERIGPDGVLRALDEDALAARSREPRRRVEAVAVCLLWGFRHPEHERRVAELLPRRCRTSTCPPRTRPSGVFREYERCATTVVDAALSPLLRALPRAARRARAGGRPAGARGDALERRRGRRRDRRRATARGPCSPARPGGAVGAARIARAAGAADARLPRHGRHLLRRVASSLGGARARDRRARGGRPRAGAADGGRAHGRRRRRQRSPGATPGGALRVGPRSAGADPGPACYGRGGEEPTVTDANLLLGYLDAESPLAGGVELDREAAERAVRGLGDGARPVARGDGRRASSGWPSAEMARRRARDDRRARHRPARLALRRLRRRRARCTPPRSPTSSACDGWWCPRASGVLSALGLVVVGAPPRPGGERAARGRRAHRARRSPRPWRAWPSAAARSSATGDAELRATLRPALRGPGVRALGRGRARARPGDLRERVRRARTRSATATRDPDAELELVTVRVAAGAPRRATVAAGAGRRRRARAATRDGRFGGERVDGRRSCAASCPRRAARPGDLRAARGDAGGPARLVAARADDDGTLLLERRSVAGPGHAPGDGRRAARGLRRDGRGARALRPLGEHQGAPRRLHRRCSTPSGEMVMQAEHIPVHLGRDAGRRGGGARRGPRAGRRLDPQRPLRGRHPPAGHHA